LAREAAREELDFFRAAIYCTNVVVDNCVGPMPSQHSPAPLINLGLPQDAHTGPLEPEVKPANP
jgi:hypothetical protein